MPEGGAVTPRQQHDHPDAHRDQHAGGDGVLPSALATVVDGSGAGQPASTRRARDATPQAAFHLDFGGQFRGRDQPGLEFGAFRAREISRDITRNEAGLLFQ
jgi:hypothetical protein